MATCINFVKSPDIPARSPDVLTKHTFFWGGPSTLLCFAGTFFLFGTDAYGLKIPRRPGRIIAAVVQHDVLVSCVATLLRDISTLRVMLGKNMDSTLACNLAFGPCTLQIRCPCSLQSFLSVVWPIRPETSM